MKVETITKKKSISGGVLWTMLLTNEQQTGDTQKLNVVITRDEAEQILHITRHEFSEYPTPGYRIERWTIINN